MNKRLHKQLQSEVDKLQDEKLYDANLLNDNTVLLTINTPEEVVRFLAIYPDDYPFRGPTLYTTHPKMISHDDFSHGRMIFKEWQPSARTLQILIHLHTMWTELT